MTTDILIDPHAQAILDLLSDLALPDGTPVRVGDHEAPRSTQQGQVVAPCAVLHLRPGGWVAGSLGRQATDILMRFQVTSVGRTPPQARIVADGVNRRLQGAQTDVEGRGLVAIGRPPGEGPIAAAQRDPQLTPSVHFVPVEYRIWTVPGHQEES